MTDMALSPRVLALANQKGGVGKTTTAINLGTALAAIGERVMIVDLDPQGNASTGLGIDERRHSTSGVLSGKVPFAVARVDTNVPGLSVVPATIDLMAFERESMAASAVPRLMAVVVLPTPPFWLATARTRGRPASGVVATLAACGNGTMSGLSLGVSDILFFPI